MQTKVYVKTDKTWVHITNSLFQLRNTVPDSVIFQIK